MTPQEEEELKGRVLKLEEERDKLQKILASRADKTEIDLQLADVKKELKEARAELAALTPVKKEGPQDQDSASAGFWP
jgi:hypothetical protein